ncbi:MAG TPA: ATP-binding protein, partial [Streptosporangiaceae bacterium]|nr:ATP-binding protein [Streptosporangiaceae bacterium]
PNAGPIVNANFVSGRTRSTPQELAQRYSVLRQLDRHRDFVSALKVIDPRIADVEVLVKDGQSSLNLSLDGMLMPLSLFGEGIVAFADIMSLIYSTNTTVLLIDEIENGIHYSVMPDIWRHIRYATLATGTQVIATTHSRECLAAAHAAFTDQASELLRLLRLSRRPGQEGVFVTSYSAREVENALELNLDIR